MKRVKIQYMKKLPENTKKVVRGTCFFNMFKLKKHGGKYTLEESLELYEKTIDFILSLDPKFLDELKGFDLGCFCKLDQPCHADILIKKLIRRPRKTIPTKLMKAIKNM